MQWLKCFTITRGRGAMICNFSQAFRKSGTLRPMPRLKAALTENTEGRVSHLHGGGGGEGDSKGQIFESLKMKF